LQFLSRGKKKQHVAIPCEGIVAKKRTSGKDKFYLILILKKYNKIKYLWNSILYFKFIINAFGLCILIHQLEVLFINFF